MFGQKKPPAKPPFVDCQIAAADNHAIAYYGSETSWEQLCEYFDDSEKRGWEVVCVWNAVAGGNSMAAFDTSVRVLYRRLGE